MIKAWPQITEAGSEPEGYKDAVGVLGKIADRQAVEVRSMAIILNVPYFHQQTDDSCAPACLRMALAFRFPDKAVSEVELAGRCRCLKGLGCLVNKVYRTARRYKLAAKWLK